MRLASKTCRLFSITLNNYAPIQQDLAALRNQMLFRSKNLGVRELDLIIGTWAKHNLPHYSHPQLLRFNQEVLHHETPELLKKILGQSAISKQQELIADIRAFALDDAFSKIENT